MSKGIVSRLRDTPEGARQHEREARMELGGLLDEAAVTIEELLGALGNLEALVTGWLRDANSPVNNPTLVAARTAIHNVVSNRRLTMDDREAALEEAINACRAREQDARSRVGGAMSPLQVNVMYLRATEARDCAEAIVKLRTKGKQK